MPLGITLGVIASMVLLELLLVIDGLRSGASARRRLVLGTIGIAGHYAFHRREPWSWGSLARPLAASPIVLLPLIGSLQGAALETVQVVSFVILAYQNGFFWREVLRDAHKER